MVRCLRGGGNIKRLPSRGLIHFSDNFSSGSDQENQEEAWRLRGRSQQGHQTAFQGDLDPELFQVGRLSLFLIFGHKPTFQGDLAPKLFQIKREYPVFGHS